jgi:hypothetical protein
MLLGASLNSAAYPFNRVSWKGFNTSFSAIVLRSDTSVLSVTTFNHAAGPISGTLIASDLHPGTYRLVQGKDGDGDGRVDAIRTSREITVTGRRTPLPLSLQPREEELVDLRPIRTSAQPTDAELPDLAVTREEVLQTFTSDSVQVAIPVHNIGCVRSPECTYVLSRVVEGAAIEVARGTISPLEAPLDLEPKIRTITLRLPAGQHSTYVIHVDEEGRVSELNESNNSCSFSVGSVDESCLPGPSRGSARGLP